MTGQAFSGMFPPIISIICVSSLLSRSIASEIFFACSAVLTGMALIGFLWLKQLGSNHSIVGTSSIENTGLDFSIRKAETALEIVKRMTYFPWLAGGVMAVTFAIVPSLTSTIVSVHVISREA